MTNTKSGEKEIKINYVFLFLEKLNELGISPKKMAELSLFVEDNWIQEALHTQLSEIEEKIKGKMFVDAEKKTFLAECNKREAYNLGLSDVLSLLHSLQ